MVLIITHPSSNLGITYGHTCNPIPSLGLPFFLNFLYTHPYTTHRGPKSCFNSKSIKLVTHVVNAFGIFLWLWSVVMVYPHPHHQLQGSHKKILYLDCCNSHMTLLMVIAHPCSNVDIVHPPLIPAPTPRFLNMLISYHILWYTQHRQMHELSSSHVVWKSSIVSYGYNVFFARWSNNYECIHLLLRKCLGIQLHVLIKVAKVLCWTDLTPEP